MLPPFGASCLVNLFVAPDDIKVEFAQVDVGEEALAVDGGDKSLVAVARREKLPAPLNEDLLRFGGNRLHILRLGYDYKLIAAHMTNECVGSAGILYGSC